MKLCRQIWFAGLYYFSWLIFGLGGLLLNFVCAPLLLLSRPRRERCAPMVRRAIRMLFSGWLKWLHLTRVVDVQWHGFENAPLPSRAVYVANHPTLVDATFLLGRMPESVCIFKHALLRHPLLGPAAVLAGYPASDQGVDTLRAAADAVAAGCSLLVFPEGTRTEPGSYLNALKPGFALIARRAHAPIQIIRISAEPDLVPRGRPWWRLPVLPSRVTFARGQLIFIQPDTPTAAIVAEIEMQLRVRPLPPGKDSDVPTGTNAPRQ